MPNTDSNSELTVARGRQGSKQRRQGIFWMLTIPRADYTVPVQLPSGLQWIRGQAEQGDGTGYEHWQIMVAFTKKTSIAGIIGMFGRTAHGELTRSAAANEYVWKEQTRIEGTQFEFGAKPFVRSSKTDWESVWLSAQRGDINAIPANVRVVSYRTIRAIASDYARPVALERSVYVFWGRTGTGKSKRAWDEASLEAYDKNPRTKFWDGYTNQQHVVIDEFRGGIDIAYLLTWFDRYPVRVEIKGSSRPLLASTIWITSNLDPRMWYPDLDSDTLDALMRRMTVTHFN